MRYGKLTLTDALKEFSDDANIRIDLTSTTTFGKHDGYSGIVVTDAIGNYRKCNWLVGLARMHNVFNPYVIDIKTDIYADMVQFTFVVDSPRCDLSDMLFEVTNSYCIECMFR